MGPLPPACYASVITPGPWWTGPEPSLRVPRVTGCPAAIWTVGDGPNLLLVPPGAGSHDVWAPLSPHLRESCTVHALDRAGVSAADDVDHIATAADAVGALFLAGYADDATVLRDAARQTRCVRRVLVLFPPGEAPSGEQPDPALMARVPVSTPDPEVLTETDAARLTGKLRSAREG